MGGKTPAPVFCCGAVDHHHVNIIIIRLRYRKCSKDRAERKQEGSKHCECSFTPRLTFTVTVRNV